MRESSARETPATVLHTLDIRTKMTLSLLCSAAVIVLSDPWALAILASASGVYASLAHRWRVQAIAYGGVLLLSAMALAFTLLLRRFFPSAARSDLDLLLAPFLRTLVMMHVLLALALTSRTQNLLAALKSLRLPYWLFIPAAIMVRYIPSIIEDARQIRDAARSMGHPLNPWSLLRAPARSLRVFCVPMLFRALRTADELGVAAEMKGVAPRTSCVPFRKGTFGRWDLATAGLALGLITASLWIDAAAPGRGLPGH